MNKTPLVSLLVPCYNHERFLDDHLQSVLAQTYENIEILICDDCSRDGSFAKLMEYRPRLQARFSRVEILQNRENTGVSRNLNRLLELAKGDYIKILASDDALAAHAIEKMAAWLEDHPAYGLVVANGEKIPEDSRFPAFPGSGPVYAEAPDFSQPGFLERTALCCEIFAPGVMLRKAIFDRHGSYDESIPVEDFEYWLRLLAAGDIAFGYLDERLVYYRSSPMSITSMVGNPGLEQRRRRFYRAEMDALKKYQPHLPRDIYARAVLRRMMDERWLAVQAELPQWEQELRQEWKAFPDKKALPLKLAAVYFWRNRKLDWKIRLNRIHTKYERKDAPNGEANQ